MFSNIVRKKAAPFLNRSDAEIMHPPGVSSLGDTGRVMRFYQAEPYSSAMASISKSPPLGSLHTSTQERAGKGAVKYLA